jgi:hypothetical protein
MRSRRRIGLLLASAAALGVGLIAFPGSAAATPPVVPTCAFPNTTGSDSCATIRVDKAGGGALTVGSAVNARLGVRVRSQFNPATSETTVVDLSFDKRIALNLAGVTPTCAASKLLGKNIAQAWAACGPGGGSTKNAFLSTGLGNNVSGIGSTTVDANGVACTMIFKGADNAHVSIYARAPIANVTTTGCNNPATNTGGSTTLVFTGTLTSTNGTTYNRKLHVVGTQTANPALDDFYATIDRGAVLKATCPVSGYKFKELGFWDYTATGDANDTFPAVDVACP